MSYPEIKLKREADRRLRPGHLWVYANEIDGKPAQLGLAPGSLVSVRAADGSLYGVGHFNPNALIAIRLLSRRERSIDAAFYGERLRAALALRERLGYAQHGRLLHGESDGVPGLVLDRYGEVLVGQLNTAGLDAQREAIAEAIGEVLQPAALVWRNDASVRELEGLSRGSEVAFGSLPEAVYADEAGLRFRIDPLAGQKTGWFYDQRDNRLAFRRLLPGAKVLDVFSYAGGWSVHALAAGARSVLSVDASAKALAEAADNAALNGHGGAWEERQGDAFEVLRELKAAGESFDAVVVDPPAFIKRRKDYDEGLLAYRRINEAAMRLLRPGGWLASCSCSHHLPTEALVEVVARGARRAQLELRIIAMLGQSADHPIHPAMPETAYLKGLIAEATPT